VADGDKITLLDDTNDYYSPPFSSQICLMVGSLAYRRFNQQVGTLAMPMHETPDETPEEREASKKAHEKYWDNRGTPPKSGLSSRMLPSTAKRAPPPRGPASLGTGIDLSEQAE